MHEYTKLAILPIVVGVVLFYLLHALHLSVKSPLSKVPGPVLARYSRIWEFIEAARGDLHWTTVKLHEKYGSSPNWLKGPIC